MEPLPNRFQEGRPVPEIHLTRLAETPRYEPPRHTGVQAQRHQGLEAGGDSPAYIATSTFAPNGVADSAPTPFDTVYLILDGELELSVADRVETLRRGDSVFLPAGTVRELANRTDDDAALVVVTVPEAAAAQ